MFAVAVLVTVGDAVTTLLILAQPGGVERNPLMLAAFAAVGPAVALVAAACVKGAMFALTAVIARVRPRVAFALYAALVAVCAWPVVANTLTLARA